MNPGLAVKAFIVREGKLLLIRRRGNDVHRAGAWDFPGGRLEPGEDPFAGLLREVREETGLSVDIGDPLAVHHFKRQDNQVVTIISFLCKARSGRVVLSEEHTDFTWEAPAAARVLLPDEYHRELDAYARLIRPTC